MSVKTTDVKSFERTFQIVFNKSQEEEKPITELHRRSEAARYF